MPLLSISYPKLLALVSAGATTQNDQIAIGSGGSMTAADPTNGTGTWWLTRSHAKALGYIPDDMSEDGVTTFGAGNSFTFSGGITAGTFDFQGVAAHEISEVLGRLGISGGAVGTTVNSFSLIDNFCYTGPGTKGLRGGPGNNFSIDNGTTLLKLWNDPTVNRLDSRDWAPGTNDAFNQFSNSGVVNGVSTVDLQLMDVIGYTTRALTIAGECAADSAADGRIEIFVRGIKNHVWHLYQTTPNGDWSEWEDLSTYRPLPSGLVILTGDPVGSRAADRRIEIFARGTDNHVWHLYQTTPNGDWSGWEDLSAYRPLSSGLLRVVGDPAAGDAADQRIEIFVRGIDNHVWHLYQTTPNGDWSAWEDLSAYRPLPTGVVTAMSEPAVASAADKRIEFFVRGTDNYVWHLYQTTPNGDWSEWENLSSYRRII